MERGPEPRTKADEPRIGSRHEALYLDQIDGACGMFPRRKESAPEVCRGQQSEKPCPADVGRRFGGKESAVGAGLLRFAGPERQCVGAVAAGVAAGAKWQAGYDAGGVGVLREE